MMIFFKNKGDIEKPFVRLLNNAIALLKSFVSIKKSEPHYILITVPRFKNIRTEREECITSILRKKSGKSLPSSIQL